MSRTPIDIKPTKLCYEFHATHIKIWVRDNYFIVSQIIKHTSDSYFHQSYLLIVTFNKI